MKLKGFLLSLLSIYVLGTGPILAEMPLGSITIDGIADIKYPTEQSWSPDGKTVAFLWDAAGKQNLYMVRPGEKPVALTDFPVNPDTLRSDIAHFEWASADTIIFAREAQLWKV